MSLAEASRPASVQAGPQFHHQAGGSSFGSSICADLARWTLESNCLLQDHIIQRHSFVGSGSIEANTSLVNVTALAQQQLQQSCRQSSGTFHHAVDSNSTSFESPLSKLVANHLLEPMYQLESKVDYYFSDIWLTSGDQRTNKLPLIGAGPWKLIYATLIYLYLIKWLLPRMMRPLRPLELNWLIRLYNLFMVISNMWAFYHGARILKFGLKCFGCETINHQDHSAQAIELLHYGWLFFISRLVEWLDTIFFVLRKKERQVTKLHVFHHSFVPLISWTYLKYHPGYTVAFFPFVNSFVHSIMYSYYLLATFGPKIQPYLWWKRYLTSLQIAQFVLIIIQLASIPLTGDDSCQYPRGFLVVAFAGAILFLWLFYTYYRETYTKNKTKQSQSADDTNQLAATTSPKSSLNGDGKKKRASSANSALGGADSREGSSRSLSDAIDNAISCDPQPAASSGQWWWKLKLN